MHILDATIPLKKPKTLVCVTDQMSCDKLIKAGRILADFSGTELTVVNVALDGAPQDPRSMEHLFKETSAHGGEMIVLYHSDASKAIIKYLKSNKVANVLSGTPTSENSMIFKLWNRFTHINYYTVDLDGIVYRMSSTGPVEVVTVTA